MSKHPIVTLDNLSSGNISCKCVRNRMAPVSFSDKVFIFEVEFRLEDGKTIDGLIGSDRASEVKRGDIVHLQCGHSLEIVPDNKYNPYVVTVNPEIVSIRESKTIQNLVNSVAVAAPFVATAIASTPTVAGPVIALGAAVVAINESTKPRD